MDQQLAKQALAPLALRMGAKYLRATALIDEPDKLNQGNYGVCAGSCIVRSLLQHDRQKFVDLVNCIYLGTKFGGVDPGGHPLLELLAPMSTEMMKFERDYYGYELDFLLSRALMVLLEQADPDEHRRQIQFSERFNKTFTAKPGTAFDLFTLDWKYAADLDTGAMTADLDKTLKSKQYWVQHQCGFGIDTGRSRIVVVSQGREWLIFCPVNDAEVQLRLRADRTGSPIAVTTKADDLLYGRGHLAVDEDGMLTMLRKVVGFAKSDLGYQDSELAIKQVNDVLAGPAPFAYGGINGFAEFVGAKGSAAARTFDAPPTPEANVYGMAPPEFAHWVAVTGPIGQTPTHYTVPVWTWQTSFTVTIKKSLIGEYFARFALGQVT